MAWLYVRSHEWRHVSTQRCGSWLRSRQTHSHTFFFSFFAYTEAPAFSSHTYDQPGSPQPPHTPPPASASSSHARAEWCSPRGATPSPRELPHRQCLRRRSGELLMMHQGKRYCPERLAQASSPTRWHPTGRCPAPRYTDNTSATDFGSSSLHWFESATHFFPHTPTSWKNVAARRMRVTSIFSSALISVTAARTRLRSYCRSVLEGSMTKGMFASLQVANRRSFEAASSGRMRRVPSSISCTDFMQASPA